jgi:hypothetical protein
MSVFLADFETGLQSSFSAWGKLEWCESSAGDGGGLLGFSERCWTCGTPVCPRYTGSSAASFGIANTSINITTTVDRIVARYYVLTYTLAIRSGRNVSWWTQITYLAEGVNTRRVLDVIRRNDPPAPPSQRYIVLNVMGLNLDAIRITFSCQSKVPTRSRPACYSTLGTVAPGSP